MTVYYLLEVVQAYFALKTTLKGVFDLLNIEKLFRNGKNSHFEDFQNFQMGINKCRNHVGTTPISQLNVYFDVLESFLYPTVPHRAPFCFKVSVFCLKYGYLTQNPFRKAHIGLK